MLKRKYRSCFGIAVVAVVFTMTLRADEYMSCKLTGKSQDAPQFVEIAESGSWSLREDYINVKNFKVRPQTGRVYISHEFDASTTRRIAMLYNFNDSQCEDTQTGSATLERKTYRDNELVGIEMADYECACGID